MPRVAWSVAAHTAVRSVRRASRPQGLATARRHMATTPRSHLFSLLATALLPSVRCSPHHWMVHGTCATSTLLARTMQYRSRYRVCWPQSTLAVEAFADPYVQSISSSAVSRCLSTAVEEWLSAHGWYLWSEHCYASASACHHQQHRA